MNCWTTENWFNYGADLVGIDPIKGQRLIKQGLVQEPGVAAGWFNLGLALHQCNNIPAAARAYNQAILLNDPLVNDAATNNLAQDLLMLGDFNNGWLLYEKRLTKDSELNKHSNYIRNYGNAWEGDSDPRPCEHLIIVAEQGLGDTIQFCRLMPILKNKGIEASLFCPESLAPLLRNCSDIGCIEITLSRHGKGIRWCPLLSLPHRLGLNHHNIPFADGYIKAEPQRAEFWRQRLGRKEGYRLIALHWQGNPDFEKTLYSRDRSMPFTALLKLGDLKGLEFVSIQKGAGSEQLQTNNRIKFVDGQSAFDQSLDFRDTAAVLANCDMLISTDGSVVHLAGAMGVPTWIALSWVPEWRWGLESSKTPWYSHARLFRQRSRGDWNTLVDEIANALREYFVL